MRSSHAPKQVGRLDQGRRGRSGRDGARRSRKGVLVGKDTVGGGQDKEKGETSETPSERMDGRTDHPRPGNVQRCKCEVVVRLLAAIPRAATAAAGAQRGLDVGDAQWIGKTSWGREARKRDGETANEGIKERNPNAGAEEKESDSVEAEGGGGGARGWRRERDGPDQASQR